MGDTLQPVLSQCTQLQCWYCVDKRYTGRIHSNARKQLNISKILVKVTHTADMMHGIVVAGASGASRHVPQASRHVPQANCVARSAATLHACMHTFFNMSMPTAQYACCQTKKHWTTVLLMLLQQQTDEVNLSNQLRATVDVNAQ